MSRDMKPRRSAPAAKSRGGTLIGMFIGLVLGVGIAAGVVWYMNKAPMPFNKNLPLPRAEMAAASGTAAQPMALPGKPGDPVPEKRFQFYDILPGKTDAVPGGKPAAEAKKEEAKKEDAKKEEAKKDEPKKEEAKKEESKQPIFLQAGSFTKPNDADNLKANLALMGVEASVQQVMVQDKTFYRVRLGPYNRIEEVNKVRSELAKAGIDASLVKKE
ncbi:MAG: Sporulation related protein [Rhodocyclaceae bacterium]|nr:Sporulation related protein [Rhodocyclaceae bacterium]